MKKISTSQPEAQELKDQWQKVKKALRTRFHFHELRPGQEEIIRSVLAGKDTLAIMPTGAGKSLCYQLPTLQLSGTTVVISPLISLMKDQLEKVQEKGISAVELNSTLTTHQNKENLNQALEEKAEILYVTPERFSNPEFIMSMKAVEIDLIAIDEAHCISQWGHDFRPAYLSIGSTIAQLGNPPILALTATATEEVAFDIQKQLGLSEMAIFRSSVLRENLNFEAQYLSTERQKFDAVLTLVRQLQDQSGIIYTATVKSAKQLHEFLNQNQVKSLLYHGKLKASEREENQNEFMNHSPRLMIATNAFGMGVDKADIRFIIHFQFPGTLEAYYQEAGRAGRDGLLARCILLYLKKDKCTQSLFLSGKYPTEEEISRTYTVLNQIGPDKQAIKKSLLLEKMESTLGKRKLLVILSLLKQLEVLKEDKNQILQVMRPGLSHEAIHQLAKVYVDKKVRDHEKLNHVITYAQSALCRWRNILQYFKEDQSEEECGHCDNCLNPSRRELAHRLSKTTASGLAPN